jgi:hypothetical protein
MFLRGSSKFNLNKNSLHVKDINKIIFIKLEGKNKNFHLKHILVAFALEDLERF